MHRTNSPDGNTCPSPTEKNTLGLSDGEATSPIVIIREKDEGSSFTHVLSEISAFRIRWWTAISMGFLKNKI